MKKITAALIGAGGRGMHIYGKYALAIEALSQQYHVLLEKPMSPDPLECMLMGEYAAKYDRIFALAHVLRYTPFFTTLKKVMDEGAIGGLISIQHNENVGFWHYAHSYVRGMWRKARFRQTRPRRGTSLPYIGLGIIAESSHGFCRGNLQEREQDGRHAGISGRPGRPDQTGLRTEN